MATNSNNPYARARQADGKRATRPTIDDVAALAGVGRATVSRALNDQANVSVKMRARVMRAVDTLGFRVNPQARNLASRTGNTLTLINYAAFDAEPNSYYFAALELGALRAAAAAGFELSIVNIDVNDPRRREKLIELVESGRSAGLILTPPLSDDVALAERLLERGCPAVCISPSDNVRGILDGVGFDEASAGQEITEYVLSQGHRRLGYLLGIAGHHSAEKRFVGFMHALERAGLERDAVTPLRGDFTFRAGVELVQQLVDMPDRPTAIICANDDMAVGGLFAAHRRNLDVPGELSIVGFDDAPISAHIWPPLTTVHQPIRRIAARAVERLIETLLRGPGADRPSFDMIGYHLVLRESVAPLRR
ncbi:LacI family DNA-binding transcriptional regulator [Sphingomonas koreensis]